MKPGTGRLEQLQGDIPWEGRSFWEQYATWAINAFFYHACGGRERPAFYDIDETFPSLRLLDENAALIREELDRVLALRRQIPPYRDLDEAQVEISSEGLGEWKAFVLYAMGLKPERNRALCPETCRLLDQIPDVFQAMFSILDPGKSLPPHRTGWMGYVRYHLGLVIPKTNPPSIRVKDQWYTWQEGKSTMLDDSWDHEVRNESDEPRVILIVDVLRPMPAYAHWVNKLMAAGARRIYAADLVRRLDRHGFA